MTDVFDEEALTGIGAPSEGEIVWDEGVLDRARKLPDIARVRWYDDQNTHVRIEFADGSHVTGIDVEDRSSPELALAMEGDVFGGRAAVWPPTGLDLNEAQTMAMKLLKGWAEGKVGAPVALPRVGSHQYFFQVTTRLGKCFRQAGMDAAMEAKLNNAVTFSWMTWHGELLHLTRDEMIKIVRILRERENQTRTQVHQFTREIKRCRDVKAVQEIIEHLKAQIALMSDELERLGTPFGEQGPAA